MYREHALIAEDIGRLLEHREKRRVRDASETVSAGGEFMLSTRVCPDFLPGPHPGLSTICAQGTTYLPTYPYMEGGYKTTS